MLYIAACIGSQTFELNAGSEHGLPKIPSWVRQERQQDPPVNPYTIELLARACRHRRADAATTWAALIGACTLELDASAYQMGVMLPTSRASRIVMRSSRDHIAEGCREFSDSLVALSIWRPAPRQASVLDLSTTPLQRNDHPGGQDPWRWHWIFRRPGRVSRP